MKFATSAPETFGAEGLAPEEVAKRIENTERSAVGYERWFERPGENFNVDVGEALFLSNSAEVQSQLLDGGGLMKSLEALTKPEERIRLASRSILLREPSADELSLLSGFLAERGDQPRDALRQMVWAILSSSETRFNY